MSLAQMLLLRSMVARFWKEPYTRRPARWRTELHDRFLLPHFVRADFQDVICDLQRAGYPFETLDTWNSLSSGGCTYHGSHPGGRSDDRFPANSYEVEGRRVARFRNMGHSSGVVDAPPEEPAGGHPYTLDLRYKPVC